VQKSNRIFQKDCTLPANKLGVYRTLIQISWISEKSIKKFKTVFLQFVVTDAIFSR